MAMTPPYFHDGSAATRPQAVRIQVQKAVMTIESDSGVIFGIHNDDIGGNIGADGAINGIDKQGATQPLPLKLQVDRKPSDPDRR